MVHTQLLGSDSMSLRSHTASEARPAYRGSGQRRFALAKGLATFLHTYISPVRLLRLLFVLLAAAVLFAGLSWLSASADPETIRPAAADESVLTVDSGDTLWNIAQDVKPSGMKTGAAVHLIMKRNGLSSSSLAAGQSLIIPARLSASDGTSD